MDGNFTELNDLTEEQLKFSALSDGLGFQPKPKFANLELNKNSSKTAATTGAKLAGPIKFTQPNPVMKNLSPQKQETKTPEASPIEKAHISEPGVPIYIRALASILDLCIVTLPLALTFKANFSYPDLGALLQSQWKSIGMFYLLFLASYYLLSESFGGQSLGKMLLGIGVVEDDKYQKPIGFTTTAKRLVFLPLGILPLGLGLISVIWESKSRAWHDKVTASIVRYRK